MNWFSSKPKLSAEVFLRGFYDTNLFPESDIGGAFWESFCRGAQNTVAQCDPAFSNVDATLLRDEMLALRFEVIGIAWLHRVKDRFAPGHSDFTCRYLEERGQSAVWERMEPYNQAVARSTSGGHDPKTRSGRGYLTFLNSMRTQLFDEWVRKGFDPKIAARAANRIGSESPWKANRTHSYLSFALTDRLSAEVNHAARLAILTLISGFYNGASDEIAKVKIIE